MGGMIPLRDASREPKRYPVVTASLIVVNVLVFLLELAGGEAFVQRWSVIPADIAAGRHWITILTAMFMHAGWMHIIGNMVFLWAFGPAIEEAMGRFRYLIFYLLCGLAASLAHVAAMPSSTVPNLGASGPFRPFANALGFTPMPASYFAYLSAATLIYLVIVQAAKGRLLRQAGPATLTKVGQKLAVATQ